MSDNVALHLVSAVLVWLQTDDVYGADDPRTRAHKETVRECVTACLRTDNDVELDTDQAPRFRVITGGLE
jgi:hypothetical protein